MYRGEPIPISIDGEASIPTVEIPVPSGYEYEVIFLYGYHDDGTSRVVNWWLDDGSGTPLIGTNHIGAYAAAALVPLQFFETLLGGYMPFMPPLVLSSKLHARMIVSSITAAKKGFIRGFVYKRPEGMWYRYLNALNAKLGVDFDFLRKY